MKLHHHLYLRKRMSKSLEPYPAHSAWMRALDKMVYAVGVVGPLMTIPQIVLIYVGQDAAGVSPISWLMWGVLDIPWILYGIAHRERPIVLTYTLWLLCNGIVFIGAILY